MTSSANVQKRSVLLDANVLSRLALIGKANLLAGFGDLEQQGWNVLFGLDLLKRELDEAFGGPDGDGTRVETHISTVRTDPWEFVVGATSPGGMP